jgi:molybdopterin converting factor subunit 1
VTVTVRYFAAAREAAGLSAETVDLPAEATVTTLLRDLVRRHPGLSALVGTLRVARSDRFVQPGTLLLEGDDVALIPPVSGG